MAHVTRRPWHLWVVGIFGAIWNGLGCIDYTITMRVRYQAYIGEFVTNSERMAFFVNMPFWAEASWALGVGGGLVGSLLLLARNRLAIPVFLASLVGLAGCTLYEYVLTSPHPLEIFKHAGKVRFVLLLWGVAVSLPLYSYWMQQNGFLK